MLHLKNLDVMHDAKQDEAWLRISVERDWLGLYGLTGPRFIAQMKTPRSTYVEVKPETKALRTFESAIPQKVGSFKTPVLAIRSDILGLNLFAGFGDGAELAYSFPLQTRLPVVLPQIIVSYTILFWLGSVVRYDPHSVHDLMESPFWILIDGFMTQSRIWLLELFQWALYQKEITLHTAR